METDRGQSRASQLIAHSFVRLKLSSIKVLPDCGIGIFFFRFDYPRFFFKVKHNSFIKFLKGAGYDWGPRFKGPTKNRILGAIKSYEIFMNEEGFKN